MGRELNESKDQEFYTIASAFQHIKRNKYETYRIQIVFHKHSISCKT